MKPISLSAKEAVAQIEDGATLIGGFGLVGIPEQLF